MQKPVELAVSLGRLRAIARAVLVIREDPDDSRFRFQRVDNVLLTASWKSVSAYAPFCFLATRSPSVPTGVRGRWSGIHRGWRQISRDCLVEGGDGHCLLRLGDRRQTASTSSRKGERGSV